jgi:hypothetical protein
VEFIRGRPPLLSMEKKVSGKNESAEKNVGQNASVQKRIGYMTRRLHFVSKTYRIQNISDPKQYRHPTVSATKRTVSVPKPINGKNVSSYRFYNTNKFNKKLHKLLVEVFMVIYRTFKFFS